MDLTVLAGIAIVNGNTILMMLVTRPQGVRWGLDVTGPGRQRSGGTVDHDRCAPKTDQLDLALLDASLTRLDDSAGHTTQEEAL